MGTNEALVLAIVVLGMIFIVPLAMWIVAFVRGRQSGDRGSGGRR
ncbi:MAG: hypothetical protein ABFS86_11225 [Planctomycetota bacterium]